MAKRIFFKAIATFVCALVALPFIGSLPSDGDAQGRSRETVELLSEEEETLDLISNGKSSYTIIYSKDSFGLDVELSNRIGKLFFENGIVTVRVKSDSLSPIPAEYEILIGATNRDETATLLGAIEEECENSDDLAYGFAVIGEKLVYAANSNIAFELGQNAFINYISDNGFSLPRDHSHISVMTKAEYDRYLEEKAASEREERLAELYEMNDAITDEMMGVTDYVPMIGEGGKLETNPYSSPWVYPTADQHPRYFINGSNYDRLAEMMNDPEYAELFATIKRLSREDYNNGVFETIPGKQARYDAMILARIEARAFMYLFTGDELYAMEALVGIKNAMLTLNYTTELHPDPYHGPDHVMRVAAEVYDWCYYAFSDADRWQIIAGVANILAPQMESGMNYPPTGMRSVSGHGTGGQFLHVWMSVAIAFYDDAPDWWELVGGRYFQDYLPVANEIYKSGWVSQGSGYGDSKLYHQLWPVFLIQMSTGERFITEDIKLSLRFMLSHMLPNDNYFETGDESRNEDAGEKSSMHLYFMYAGIFNDPTVLAWAKYLSNGYSEYTYTTVDTMTPVHQMCFAALVDTYATADRGEGLDLINFFKAPAGVMMARNSWTSEDAVIVRMDIGDRTMANHDIYDHGSFQIYYKGLLAATSGSYHKYGSAHHQMYTQQTISQNGLLIFNPSYASQEPKLDAAGNVTNYTSYYYSGGQRCLGEAGALSVWLSDTYTMAETTGARGEYNIDGTPKYAYIAGDITKAYPANTVDYVGRRMLTIFTGDEEMPALFVTFDQIDSVDPSFTKTFLLHTIKEPEVDAEGKTAVVTTNGEGRMYVTSVFGADEIVKIGGEGKAWWINGYYNTSGDWVEGKNLTDSYHKTDNSNWIWGRIELRASGAKETEMLTVFGITDVQNNKAPVVSGFKSDMVTGVIMDERIAAFVNTKERYYKAFSFETEGNGLYEYYISGIEAGTWQVFVDGVSVAFAHNADDEGFISFVAPTGSVTVKPCSDVIGENGGRITYVTDGGAVGDGAPYVYRMDSPVDLPNEVVRGSDVFLGWYTSPTYEEATRVTKTPTDHSGKLVLYAKWFSNFLNEDFAVTNISITNMQMYTTGDGVTFMGNLKENVSFKTVKGEDGVKYLEWIQGNNDPLICQKSDNKNFTDIHSEDKTVSFTWRIAPNGDATPMSTAMKLMAKVNVNGDALSSASSVVIFSTNDKGEVRIGSNGAVIGQLAKDEITTVRIAVDFKNGLIKAYDEANELIDSVSFTAPVSTGATSTEEFMKCLTEYLWYWYAGTSPNKDAAMRIYGMRVQEGNEFDGMSLPQTSGIKYHTGGASLPDDARKSFNEDGSATPLPTSIEKPGYIFAGWYTDATYAGDPITEVPEGTDGLFEVYAKWYRVLVDETYEKNTVGVKESTTALVGGISYNAGHGGEQKPGSTFYTERDESGNTYLKISVQDKNALMTVTSDDYNMTHFTESAISFSLDLGKIKDLPLATYTVRLASSGSNYGYTVVLTVDGASGEVRLGSSSKGFATLGEDAMTNVRFTVDFEEESLTAYDKNGEILDTVPLGAVPKCKDGYTQPMDWLTWQSVAEKYLFYGIMTRPTGTAAGTLTYLALDNLKVVEGRAWGTGREETVLKNSIIYNTTGGSLPIDAPTEFDPEGTTVLPMPVRDGYVFAGWYESDSFTGSVIESVEHGRGEPLTVFAKWLEVLLDEDYENVTIEVKESSMADKNGIRYNAGHAGEPKPGSTFYTEEDENGNKYLRATVQDKNALMTVNSDLKNYSTLKETAVSFRLDIGKHADYELSAYEMRVSCMGGYHGNYVLLRLDAKTGEVKLSASDVVICTVADGQLAELHVTVDFAAATVTAYDSDLNVIVTASLGQPPKAKEGYTQAQTWLEWQSLAANYLFYGYQSRPDNVSTGTVTAITLDNLAIFDGRVFEAPGARS